MSGWWRRKGQLKTRAPSPAHCSHMTAGHDATSVRLLSELRQRSVAPKQKQLVQPLGLVGSRWKVPTRHWSQREPCTFSCRGRQGDAQCVRAGWGVCECVCVRECVWVVAHPPCTDTVRCRSRTLPPLFPPRCSHMTCSWGNQRNQGRSGRTGGPPRCSYTCGPEGGDTTDDLWAPNTGLESG